MAVPGSLTRTAVGVDIGTRHFCACKLQLTIPPKPPRKRKMDARDDTPVPLPVFVPLETGHVVSWRMYDLVNDLETARYDRAADGTVTWHVVPNGPEKETPEVVRTDVYQRLGEHLCDWPAMWTDMTPVFVEVQPRKMPKMQKAGDDNLVKIALSKSVFTAVGMGDRFLKRGRRVVKFTAKKAGVLRGTQYSEDKQHKAEAVARLLQFLEAQSETEALKFARAVLQRIKKQDDIADSLLMALRHLREH